jgi:hypothetical protein
MKYRRGLRNQSAYTQSGVPRSMRSTYGAMEYNVPYPEVASSGLYPGDAGIDEDFCPICNTSYCPDCLGIKDPNFTRANSRRANRIAARQGQYPANAGMGQEGMMYDGMEYGDGQMMDGQMMDGQMMDGQMMDGQMMPSDIMQGQMMPSNMMDGQTSGGWTNEDGTPYTGPLPEDGQMQMQEGQFPATGNQMSPDQYYTPGGQNQNSNMIPSEGITPYSPELGPPTQKFPQDSLVPPGPGTMKPIPDEKDWRTSPQQMTPQQLVPQPQTPQNQTPNALPMMAPETSSLPQYPHSAPMNQLAPQTGELVVPTMIPVPQQEEAPPTTWRPSSPNLVPSTSTSPIGPKSPMKIQPAEFNGEGPELISPTVSTPIQQISGSHPINK